MTNSSSSREQVARWIPLLVIGTSLNTLGIVLSGPGAFRYILMGAGLLLLLLSVVKLISASRADEPPSKV